MTFASRSRPINNRMDYKRIYTELVNRARQRTLITFAVESHHVIPRSMGGDDTPANLVLLTPREHYIAHQLLFKIHENDHPTIIFALPLFFHRLRVNSLRGIAQYRKWIRRRIATVAAAETRRKNRERIALFNRDCEKNK